MFAAWKIAFAKWLDDSTNYVYFEVDIAGNSKHLWNASDIETLNFWQHSDEFVDFARDSFAAIYAAPDIPGDKLIFARDDAFGGIGRDSFLYDVMAVFVASTP